MFLYKCVVINYIVIYMDIIWCDNGNRSILYLSAIVIQNVTFIHIMPNNKLAISTGREEKLITV